MESNLSPNKDILEEVLKKAEPYPEDDPIWDQMDGECDLDRLFATLAKMALEGRL